MCARSISEAHLYFYYSHIKLTARDGLSAIHCLIFSAVARASVDRAPGLGAFKSSHESLPKNLWI